MELFILNRSYSYTGLILNEHSVDLLFPRDSGEGNREVFFYYCTHPSLEYLSTGDLLGIIMPKFQEDLENIQKAILKYLIQKGIQEYSLNLLIFINISTYMYISYGIIIARYRTYIIVIVLH